MGCCYSHVDRFMDEEFNVPVSVDAAIDFLSGPDNWKLILNKPTAVVIDPTTFEIGGAFLFSDVHVDKSKPSEQLSYVVQAHIAGFRGALSLEVTWSFTPTTTGSGCTIRRVIRHCRQHRLLLVPLIPIARPVTFQENITIASLLANTSKTE
ncbi:Aste57867_7750 [Aphanomyces stellatus]|uniref:Aste57867_7750 protein n=1 Tax=Aphanomyces stellatus TaxID=120398 RepID=A0A485KIR1_9STRA|nr:hypothetical protein As57867_007721 [Aphanomyces stellatus]VFT84650.1 Aste57867_7750 [Aphanomyces stellatus]